MNNDFKIFFSIHVDPRKIQQNIEGKNNAKQNKINQIVNSQSRVYVQGKIQWVCGSAPCCCTLSNGLTQRSFFESRKMP